MSRINVLVVEDEPLIATDIEEYLTNVDYKVSTIAKTKTEALNALKNHDFDLALLDINLGNNMDGFDIANTINSHYGIPFLYLTSYSGKNIVNQAKVTRPMGYILKPFEEDDLFCSIEIALYNHGQNQRPQNLCLRTINDQIFLKITSKEFDILEDIFEGKTNKQMATKHYVSINTIKSHVKNLYEKLETHSRSGTIVRIRELMNN
ncbi:response regulator transcription factor [Membranihabitans maritimus]|uniref:response regulator transcription factor n=1 Tax=Membranihabitans maritimus TaxID=2904244 RepID=UPI001F1B019F|nr:response regulator transcription factor [Membranihabitans maritimus]